MVQLNVDNCELFIFTSSVVNTNMYVIIDEGEAFVIDPHENHEIISLLLEKKIYRLTICLTHEHPDHTCGCPSLCARFDTTLICHSACAVRIADRRNNRPILLSFVLAERDKMNGTSCAKEFKNLFPVYECHADIVFDREYTFAWHSHNFICRHTPGHSPGSCCLLWNGNNLFTGDSLILNTPVITRFPGGSEQDYLDFTYPYLKDFPGKTIVFPGHGKYFSMKEVNLCGTSNNMKIK